MPKFAHIAERVACPSCGADLAYIGRVGFQWGFCAYPYSDSSREAYRIGDAIRWRADTAGRVPVWRYFVDSTANIGEPRCADLVLRESEFGIDTCTACGRRCGGIAITIRHGRIQAVSASFDWPLGVDIYIIAGDGALTPRPDWTDRPMTWGSEGGRHPNLIPNSDAVGMADPE